MMDITQIVEQLNKGALGWGAIIVLLLSFVEIAPIKINPWSYIAQHIGRSLNREIKETIDKRMNRFDTTLEQLDKKVDSIDVKVKDLDSKVDMVDQKNDTNAAVTARVRILRFNDELLSNTPHSKESFDQVLTDIDVYEQFCQSHPSFKNSVAVMAIENIRSTYQKRLLKHDFLVATPEEDSLCLDLLK